MRKKNVHEDKRLLDALDHIDERFIAETEKYYRDLPTTRMPQGRPRITARSIKQVLALAACLALLSAVIPVVSYLAQSPMFIPGATADGTEATEPETENLLSEDITSVEEETISEPETEPEPVYDGSRGLEYEVREDGETARFIGFGSCTDEVVYIASTYNGLPVVEIFNKGYWEANYIPADHDYCSKYAKRIVISDTVETVDEEVIRQCPNIESVYYGASVEYIDALPFNNSDGQNFASVEVSPDNKNFSDKGNCIVDLRTKTLVIATPTTVIPDDGSVEIIGRMAFSSASSGLTSIVIPEGVKVLDHSAFRSCFELESVVLPDSLEVIEANAFGFCISLKTLELGTNLKAFNQNIFHPMYCPKIYYKGTVAQWEAIAKPLNSNAGIETTVICTDGNALSNAGDQSQYQWYLLPEFEGYMTQKQERARKSLASETYATGTRYFEIGNP